MVVGILVAIRGFLAWLLTAAGAILNFAFNFAVRPEWFYSEPVVAGWTLMRDFANIWFVLVILFIAIATILRIESYQAKKTLSWVIAIALLINFSLPLARVIIDFTNILTLQFIDAIGGNNKKQVGNLGTVYDISGQVMNSLAIQNLSGALSPELESEIKQQVVLETAPPQQNEKPSLGLIPKAQAVPLLAILGWITNVAFAIMALINIAPAVTSWFSGQASLGSISTSIFIGLPLHILLLLAAVYVIGTLAVLLIIRTVVLMLLVTLAPAGLILTILPGAEAYASRWWTTLIKQAFFAPAVAFLLWVAISLGKGINQSVGFVGGFAGGDLGVDPVSVKLFFYVFNIILLYGCLKVAQSMGAVGADTAITWFGKARSWVTGAVGGVALRNTVGRLGGLMQQVPAIEHSVFGKRISQMMTKAGARLPGGSYEELQKERAAMAMQQGESRWADEFLKAGTPGRLAMLNAMSDQQKNDLRERLKTLSSTGAQAFDNAMRLHFGEAALGKVDLEGWKRSDKDAQKNLAPYSPEVTEQILRSFPDDDARAKWMAGLTPENRSKAMGAMNARFSTAEMNKYGKAEKRQEMRGKELTGGDEFDKFVNDLPSDKDSDYIEAADNHQLLSWLESVTKIGGQAQRAEKLRKYQSVMKNRLGTVEEQDNFNKNVIRRASMPAFSSFVNALPDDVSRERVIGSSSSAQQAQLWASDKAMRSVIGIAVGKQSVDVQRAYHSNLGNLIGEKTPEEIYETLETLPPEVQASVIEKAHQKISSKLESAPKIIKDKVGEIVRQHGLQETYKKDLPLETYSETILNQQKGTAGYKSALKRSYSATDPKTLRKVLKSEKLEDADFVENMMENGGIEAVTAINKVPELRETLGKTLQKIISVETSKIAPEIRKVAEASMQESISLAKVPGLTADQINENVASTIEKELGKLRGFGSVTKETVVKIVRESETKRHELESIPGMSANDIRKELASILDKKLADMHKPEIAETELTLDNLSRIFEIKYKNKELADSARVGPGKRVWEALLKLRRG